jgi:hypothetical protein
VLVQKVPKSGVEQKDQMEAATFLLFTLHSPSYEAYKHMQRDRLSIHFVLGCLVNTEGYSRRNI